MRIDIPDGGWVQLDEAWGSDEAIAARTRVSTDSKSKGALADRKLFRTLLENEHGSPLEFGGLVFKIKMPLALVSQLQRHRMASYSQRSARYVEMKEDYFKPEIWRAQAKRNRQASEGEVPDQEELSAMYQVAIDVAFSTYQRLLAKGVSREQARLVLPISTFTELYVSVNIRSLLNILWLRTASDAQKEINLYADAMFRLFLISFPLLGGMAQKLFTIKKSLLPLASKLWDAEMEE